MAGISGIEPAAAAQHAGAQSRELKQSRAPVEFGAAVTHRDAVREKLRVDPAALADKMRTASAARNGEGSRRDRLRAERLAQQDAAYEERKARKGALVDVKA